MGLIDDAKAIKIVQRIKRGETDKLSVSQITGLIINLMDARQNLSEKEYKQIENKFFEMRKDDKKIEMNIEKYVNTVVEIIRTFDGIAPYEKYSGLDETSEFIAFMKDVRLGKDNKNSSH